MPDGDQTPDAQRPETPAPDIADASGLFQDPPATAKEPADRGPTPGSGSAGVFELGEHVESRVAPKFAPASWDSPSPEPSRGERASAGRAQAQKDRTPETSRDREFKAASRSAFGNAADVDQVWSRMGEWGPTLAVLIGWSFAELGILYLLMGAEYFTLAFFVLIVGGFVWVYLCYPILITLEIPVRLTPESAIKDFFGSLSHHMPHYRRMWLLLTRQAKTTPYFGSYEGFKNYWRKRVKELKKEGDAEAWTPLLFQVDNFGSEKNADNTVVQTQFTVNIFVRGRRDEGPVASIPMRVELIRGPDKMLYLTNGTLPAAVS